MQRAATLLRMGFKWYKGSLAQVVEASHFHRVIGNAFGELDVATQQGAVLLYNIGMGTMDLPEHMARFTNVWLRNYAGKPHITSIALLVPVQNSGTLCPWTNARGLSSMLEHYETFGPRVADVRDLCRKTHYATVQYQRFASPLSGSYAFCMCLVVDRQESVARLLDEASDKDSASWKKLVNGIRVILGAGIDRPFSQASHEKGAYDYSFVLVMPNWESADMQGIVREHVDLFVSLWRNRSVAMLGVTDHKLALPLALSAWPAAQDTEWRDTWALDGVFAWYGMFLSPEGALKAVTSRTKQRRAVEFLRVTRCGAGPWGETDVRAIHTHVQARAFRLALGEARVVGQWMSTDPEVRTRVGVFDSEVRRVCDQVRRHSITDEKGVGFCVFGRPSSGKTLLVETVGSNYADVCIKLTLRGDTKDEDVIAWAKEVRTESKRRLVCAFIDEIDTPCAVKDISTLLYKLAEEVPALSRDRGTGLVIIVAGSRGESIRDMQEWMARNLGKKAKDFLQRLRVAELEVGWPTLLDRVYLAAMKMLHVGTAVNSAQFGVLLFLATWPLFGPADIANRIAAAKDSALRADRELRVEDMPRREYEEWRQYIMTLASDVEADCGKVVTVGDG